MNGATPAPQSSVHICVGIVSPSSIESNETGIPSGVGPRSCKFLRNPSDATEARSCGKIASFTMATATREMRRKKHRLRSFRRRAASCGKVLGSMVAVGEIFANSFFYGVPLKGRSNEW